MGESSECESVLTPTLSGTACQPSLVADIDVVNKVSVYR